MGVAIFFFGGGFPELVVSYAPVQQQPFVFFLRRDGAEKRRFLRACYRKQTLRRITSTASVALEFQFWRNSEESAKFAVHFQSLIWRIRWGQVGGLVSQH